MKSKTKIEKQLKKKSNPELVRTVIAAKKENAWLEVASILTSPKRKRVSVNLSEIDSQAKDNETIVVPGKILSQGEITKKIKIVALSFSDKAKEKLLNSKIEARTILEEIKKNPEAKGIRVLK